LLGTSTVTRIFFATRRRAPLFRFPCHVRVTVSVYALEKQRMAVEFLRNDSQARKAFIEKIAAPVLNKMFECGMIP